MASGAIPNPSGWDEVAVTQASTMRIRAKSDGTVIALVIDGYIQSAATSSVLATVDSAYRPASAQWLSCVSALSGSTTAYATRVLFGLDGTLKIYDLPSAGTWSFGGGVLAFLR